MERKMFAKQRRHDKGKKGENDKDKDKDKDKEAESPEQLADLYNSARFKTLQQALEAKITVPLTWQDDGSETGPYHGCMRAVFAHAPSWRARRVGAKEGYDPISRTILLYLAWGDTAPS